MENPKVAQHTPAKALFHLMAENMPGVVWSVDAELRFTSFFGAGLPLLGLETDEVVGTTLFEFFRTDDEDFPPIACHHRALQGESVAYEQTWLGRTYQVRVEPLIEKEAGIIGCMGIAHDITEHKQAEEALRDAHDELEQRVEERTAELAKANDQLQYEQRTLKQLLKSHDEERKLIAYEIHDGLAQQLAAAMMHFEVFEQQESQDAEVAAKSYGRGVRIVQECLKEARCLFAGVRPPILDELGVVAAIRNLVYECRTNGGPELHFRSEVGFDRLEPVLENALYRIVQDSLSNACRHSNGDKVFVELTQKDDSVRVEIRGRGIGFDPAKIEEDAFGLESIQKRARLLGGSAAIHSVPGDGTCVVAKLPLSIGE